MSKQRLIRLSAENAEEESEGSFRVNMDTSFLSNILAVSLKTCVFRNNVYNVTRDNSDFAVDISGNPALLTIPEDGFYTTQELITILQPLLQAQLDIHAPGSTIDTFQIGAYSKKIEIQVTGALMLYNPVAGGQDGTLNPFLGNVDTTGIVPDGTQVTFSDFPDLGGLESATVQIKSKSPKTILNVSETKLRHTNSLGVIPMTVPFGGLQSFIQPDLDSAQLVFNFPEDLTNLEFKLRNKNGKILTDQKRHLVIELMVWHQ